MSDKRKRGRPPGEGVNDDRPLAMIAELMVTRPCGLYAAAKEISLRSPWADKAGGSEASLHRWQRKWKVGGIGAKLLAAANEQHRRKTVAKAAPVLVISGPLPNQATIDSMMARATAFQKEMDRIAGPGRRKMEEMLKAVDTPAFRAMQARMTEFANSPQAWEMQRVAVEIQERIRDLPPVPKFYLPDIIKRPR